MANTPDPKEGLREYLKKTDRRVTCANENGLFATKKEFEDILQKIEDVRTNLGGAAFSESFCNKTLSLALDDYFRAVRTKTRWWRLQNLYAGYIWAYLVLFLTAVFLFYHSNLDDFLLAQFPADRVGLDAAAWGVVGGILRGLWNLWNNVNRGSYRHVWRIWFISAPFIGGIFGGIIYLTVTAGLIVVSEQNSLNVNPFVVMIFSAIAGFNWEWAVKKLDAVAEQKT
ncbi:MAG TPA: hypothetical protein VGA94_01760 [Thermodesulfobacteriota bacterium]